MSPARDFQGKESYPASDCGASEDANTISKNNNNVFSIAEYLSKKNEPTQQYIPTFTEEELVAEMVSGNYLVHIEPKREYTLHLKLKCIQTGQLRSVKP
jgi:hypothetical protein